MKVLMLSADAQALEKANDVSRRIVAYARHFDAIDVIVLSEKCGGFTEGNVHVHSSQSLFRWSRGIGALLVAAQLQKPDVVTAQDPFETGLIALVIARLRGAALHVQIHTDFLDPAFVRGSFLNRIRCIIARFVLPRATRVRVVSERIRSSLEAAHYKLKSVSVLPIYVDTKKYAGLERAKHPRFPFSLLWIGRLEPEKNAQFALIALKATRDSGHDAGLTIIGEGSERAELESRAQALELQQYVGFAGWQRDLLPYFKTTDLVLVTSKYEGYGMAIVEALAAGIPVLSTDVGIAREAGAIVTTEQEFPRALVEWIEHGARNATLAQYPYRSFDDYVRAWCEDIHARGATKVR